MSAELAGSWLFVPGSRPDRFAKAAAAGADQVILDLEDAVGSLDKDTARQHVANWLSADGSGWVRINAVGTPWHEADVAAIAVLPGLRGVVVPKAESPAELMGVAMVLPPRTRILALVETAAGVAAAGSLAASQAVSGLAFGSVDFLLDIDAEDCDDALAYARGALVVAARAAGLPRPVDGVTLETRDAEAVARDARRARRTGFGGKLCIHPAQVAPTNTAFAPSDSEIGWAEKVLGNAPQGPDGRLREGAFDLDGQMIDKPLLERARRIIARADRVAQPH